MLDLRDWRAYHRYSCSYPNLEVMVWLSSHIALRSVEHLEGIAIDPVVFE